MTGDTSNNRMVSSEDLAGAIGLVDFSGCSATVIGFGNMGKQYVDALKVLGVTNIRVCARSKRGLHELENIKDIEVIPSSFENLEIKPRYKEVCIVATPIESLASCAIKLAHLGFDNLLIEKPVCIVSSEIQDLEHILTKLGASAFCAYNRLSYPSFHEVRFRALNDGGITSCHYNFTEWIKSDWVRVFSELELQRWGVANSIHVLTMAHGLIGRPDLWHGHRAGGLSWHPAGSVFVGSGISDQGVPFSYEADWGGTGRWSVEINTTVSSYLMCPLEQVFIRSSKGSDWSNLPIHSYDSEIKPGLVEQIAATLSPEVRKYVPLADLDQAAYITMFAESILGYKQPDDNFN